MFTGQQYNEIGFGLGFRIIKDFVSKNNGRLDIESLLGEGASIIIYLPASENALNIFEEKLREYNDSPIKKDLLSGKSILIVDDDPLILLHLRSILQPYVSIIEAKNGIEGIEEAKKNIPDLIVSDVEMPEMDGIEMFRTIKENTHTSNIPLLFLSANNSTNERLSGLSYGAIDYIAKPFDEKEFILKICNILLWQRNQQVQILANTYNNDETKNEQINPLLKQLLDVIKENYTQPDFSFDDIAQALGMSKSTLSRRLKSLTDKSPVEILSEYRLNKAKQLLKDSTMTISEVAYSVGFNDPLYFSRKYKENFGITPSEEKG